ncbi:hypothetical protein SOVF_019730 [Spinacia oleracea]|nr:hypothetical protein SOVF_019730 [Spinacia oleracea]
MNAEGRLCGSVIPSVGLRLWPYLLPAKIIRFIAD